MYENIIKVILELIQKQTNKQTPWPSVRERTIPTLIQADINYAVTWNYTSVK
jgi:hypothetical protein